MCFILIIHELMFVLIMEKATKTSSITKQITVQDMKVVCHPKQQQQQKFENVLIFLSLSIVVLFRCWHQDMSMTSVSRLIIRFQ